MTDGERLARHVAWSQDPGVPPWVGFVFTDDPGQVRELRSAARGALPPGRHDRVLTAWTPTRLRRALAALMEEPGAALVWVCALHDEAPATPPGPWTEAWDWLMLRANERRQLLLHHLGGGLIFAAPTAAKARFREAAPDLWSARSLLLEPPPSPTAPAPLGAADRSRIAEALQRASLHEAHGDVHWLALASSPTPAPLEELHHAFADARPGLDWRLWRPGDSLGPRLAPTVLAGRPDALRSLPPSIRQQVSFEVHLGTWAPARDLDALDATWRALDLAPSALDRLHALERIAGAVWQQGWASEAAAVADDLVREAEAQGDGPERDAALASGLEIRARARRARGELAEALSDVGRAVELRRRVPLADAEARSELARACSLQGQLLLELRDLDGAEAPLREALALRDALAAWSDDADSLAELSLSWSLLGDLHLARAEPTVAEASFRDALRLRRRLAEETGAERHRRALALTWGRLGRALGRQGRWREALAAHEQAVSLAERLLAEQPHHPAQAAEEASVRTQLAEALAALGDAERAARELRVVVARVEELARHEPENARWADLLDEASRQLATLTPSKR